jgi:hypothetical protein
MANISSYLAAILAAVYGEDVRGSIHDAIDIINKVGEVLLNTGTAVTGPTSPSTGFYDGSFYINTSTMELWKCIGTDTWQSQGVLKGADGADGNGIVSIAKTATVGLVDTYTITFDDGSTTTYDITNGQNGSKWYKGTAISGTGTSITGFPGTMNDFYLNSSDGYVYICTKTGGSLPPDAAEWDYVMTLTGGGGTSVTVIDNLTSTSSTDALSANQGRVLKGLIDAIPSMTVDQTYNASSTNAQSGTAVAGAISTKADASDVSAIQAVIPAGASSGNKLATVSQIPIVNSGILTIQKNGSTVQTFSADQVSNVTANIITDDWVKVASVSSGSVTFSGIDDTGNYGYEVFFEITSSSTNKNPSAQLSVISGEGTSNMSLTYTTDADNGTNNAKLRRIK